MADGNRDGSGAGRNTGVGHGGETVVAVLMI